MPAYRKLEEGLFELDSPAGPLPVTSSEAELRAAGHYPAMLAQNTPPPDGGISQIPGLGRVLGTGAPSPSRLDAQTITAPPGFAAPVESPESVAASDAQARQVINKAREEKSGGRPLRGGGEIREIGEDPAFAQQAQERPRYAKVGGKDIRAGFNIQRSLLDPADVQAAEEAESEASLDRRLATQTIAERQGSRVEQVSAELGRQIRREGVALREKEERDRSMRLDYEARQQAIDEERARVEALEVDPKQFWDEKSGIEKVIAAIAVLAGGFAAGYSGRNPALEAINQQIEQNIALQREKIERRRLGLEGRETELERLVKIYGSPDAAEAELRDRQQVMVQRLGEKMALDAGATDAAERLRLQFADWDTERAQSRLARQQALAGTVTEQHQHIPERVVQVGGPKPRTEEQRKRLVRVGGREGYVVAESDRRPVQETVSTLEHLEGQLDRLAQIVEQTGVGDIEKQRQIESLVGSLGPALSVAQGQGAMSDDERKAVENRLGNAQSLLGNKDRARTLIGETKQFFGEKKGTVVRGSVYADPDATTPLVGSQSQRRRYE